MYTELLPPGDTTEVIGLYEVAAHRLHRFDQFNEFPISIGRTARNAIQLAFDASVSALHCFIDRDKDGYIIYDQHSKNGITIAGARVARFPLRPGTKLYLGRAELYVMGPGTKIPITATTESSFLRRSERVYGSARAAERHVNVSHMTILRAIRKRTARASGAEEDTRK